MGGFSGTVKEFRAGRAGFSVEDLRRFSGDERPGIRKRAESELRRRRKASAASVTFVAHMAQDGTVVLDELHCSGDPDFLELSAVALTKAADEARSRHASAIALGTA